VIDATLRGDGALDVQRAGIIRTARKLFDGTVFARDH
jgi:2-methylaconitate cis-trans-isomerase PrpF